MPAGAQPATPPVEDPYEGAVPPGYDWPTHGGYLGCLMGTVAGCLIGGFLGANLFSFLWASRILTGPLFILLALVVFLICVWLFGRVGWGLGRRFYRAYEQSVRPVWGEDDEPAIAPATNTTTVVGEAEGGKSATC
jgi:hypothetical protein